MDSLSINTTTITTLIGIFFVVTMFTLYHRSLSTLLTAILVAVIIALAFETVTGFKLFEIQELLTFISKIIIRLFHWIAKYLLPEISNAVEDIVNSFVR